MDPIAVGVQHPGGELPPAELAQRELEGLWGGIRPGCAVPPRVSLGHAHLTFKVGKSLAPKRGDGCGGIHTGKEGSPRAAFSALNS